MQPSVCSIRRGSISIDEMSVSSRDDDLGKRAAFGLFGNRMAGAAASWCLLWHWSGWRDWHNGGVAGRFCLGGRAFNQSGNDVSAPDGLYRFWCTTEPPGLLAGDLYDPLDRVAGVGDWAAGYRVLNLFLHALNAVLVWRVLVRLRVPWAWLAGAIFAVHPVNVEAVAWILQRKTVLSVAFGFGSLWCWLRFKDDIRLRWYFAAIGLFLLGMLSRVAIVMWPFVLLLCRWWQTGRITRRDFSLTLPFFLISLGLGLVQTWFQVVIASQDSIVRHDSLYSRVLLAGPVVWFYLSKAFWPLHQSLIYPLWPLEPHGVLAWLPDLSLVTLFAVLFSLRRTGEPPDWRGADTTC